jgi:trigger factor
MIEVPNSQLKVSTRAAPRSSVVLEVEFEPEQVRRTVDQAVRHLSRRTKVPGFRPGKVPRSVLERALGVRRDDPSAPNPLYDDAKEHLFESSVIQAVQQENLDVLSIPEPEWLSFDESAGASYQVTLPIRPEVKLGAYTDYPFGIQLEVVDDARIDKVVDELRDQQATLVPAEDRPARKGDWAVIAFTGRRNGEVIEGATAERLPLIIGEEGMVPGFEEQLQGMSEGETKTFTVTFPDDYPQAELAGQPAEFEVRLLELREKRLPELDEDFIKSVGDFAGLAEMRSEIGKRLERNERDRARHRFADRIIDFAVANATVELPDLLVERELEVMLDELKVRLAEQRIGYEDYLRATERDEAQLIRSFRPDAEKRVKTLLVLGDIAEKEGIQISDAELDAETERSRQSYAGNPNLVAYLDSARGRSYTRSLLRRSKTVETLIDRWIDEHPEFKDVQHLHDDHAHDHDHDHDHEEGDN